MSNPYLETSPYSVDRGEKVGKIPRKISMRDLNGLCHARTPIKAIRAKCLDCCQGSKSEVRKCVAFKCPVWPMRMGTNPFHGQSLKTRKKTPDASEGKSEASEISQSQDTQYDE